MDPKFIHPGEERYNAMLEMKDHEALKGIKDFCKSAAGRAYTAYFAKHLENVCEFERQMIEVENLSKSREAMAKLAGFCTGEVEDAFSDYLVNHYKAMSEFEQKMKAAQNTYEYGHKMKEVEKLNKGCEGVCESKPKEIRTSYGIADEYCISKDSLLQIQNGLDKAIDVCRLANKGDSTDLKLAIEELLDTVTEVSAHVFYDFMPYALRRSKDSHECKCKSEAVVEGALIETLPTNDIAIDIEGDVHICFYAPSEK